MKRFSTGIILGLIVGLLLATATFALADNPIKLIVNGQEISFPDAPPQRINDRVMVPARPLAEALGATVVWDEVQNAVIVTSTPAPAPTPPQEEPGDQDEDQGGDQPGEDQDEDTGSQDENQNQGNNGTAGTKKVTPIYEITPEGNTRIGEKTETDSGMTWKYKDYDSEGNVVSEGAGGSSKGSPPRN